MASVDKYGRPVTYLHRFDGTYGQQYAKLDYTLSNPSPQHNLKNPSECFCNPPRLVFVEGEGWKEIEEEDEMEDSSPAREDSRSRLHRELG